MLADWCKHLIVVDALLLHEAKPATFTAQNNARRLLLGQKLNSLKKAPTESIEEFVARAKELATNLEAIGHKPEDSKVSLSLLAGLPKEYSVLVTILGTLQDGDQDGTPCPQWWPE